MYELECMGNRFCQPHSDMSSPPEAEKTGFLSTSFYTMLPVTSTIPFPVSCNFRTGISFCRKSGTLSIVLFSTVITEFSKIFSSFLLYFLLLFQSVLL